MDRFLQRFSDAFEVCVRTTSLSSSRDASNCSASPASIPEFCGYAVDAVKEMQRKAIPISVNLSVLWNLNGDLDLNCDRRKSALIFTASRCLLWNTCAPQRLRHASASRAIWGCRRMRTWLRARPSVPNSRSRRRVPRFQVR